MASLSVVHEAGRRAGLERRVIAIGARPGWIDQLIGVPGQIGRQIGITAPDLAADRLRAALAVANPQLIKWDARPGNAMATSTETGTKEVMWFDWEHCGCRDPLDDLAWLLGDEWAPENESVETEILDRHIGDFAGRRGRDEARAYLMIFGTFHMAVRLSLILEHKGNGAWWDRDYCLTHDKIGITPEGVRRTCRRAARWSAADPLTAPLSRWFQQAEEHILSANPDSGADTRPKSGK